MYFIFRPGTLGDQAVLKNVLKNFPIEKENFVLIERSHKGRAFASSYRDYLNIFSSIYLYNNAFDLFTLLLNIRKKYGKQDLIYLPHSSKSSIRFFIDLLLFSLAFTINIRGVLEFYRMRWKSGIVVPEYDRLLRILSKSIGVESQSEVPRAKESYSEAQRKIVIAPCSAWPSKDWDKKNFKTLIQILDEMGAEIHLMGGKNDPLQSYYSQDLMNKIKLHQGEQLISIEKCIESADVFIGVDSALSHMACGLDVPSIILYSDTNRREDWKPSTTRVIGIKCYVQCGGCFSHDCKNFRHECMDGITVELVLAAYQQLFGGLK